MGSVGRMIDPTAPNSMLRAGLRSLDPTSSKTIDQRAQDLQGAYDWSKNGTPAPTVPAPPPAPDLTDEVVRQAQLAERRRQMSAQGYRSMFLTGARGLGGTTSLLGA
jgi:hypothetical protein